jgi:hypothetical protein
MARKNVKARQLANLLRRVKMYARRDECDMASEAYRNALHLDARDMNYRVKHGTWFMLKDEIRKCRVRGREK